jgi:hypothetical protein
MQATTLVGEHDECLMKEEEFHVQLQVVHTVVGLEKSNLI